MQEAEFLKQLAKRITHERKRQNITQEELAFDCFIDKTYLARIEAGSVNPSIRILYRIARKLRVKMRDLFKYVL